MNDIDVVRDINIVTQEIQELCHEAQRTMLLYAVEIGRRLCEAKDMLPHGEFSKWLESEVHFSQSTANKHMKIFKEYGADQMTIFGAALKSETYTNLTYSQALKLLPIDESEREEFIIENNVQELSTRELDALIKERDAAIRAKEEAEAEAERFEALADNYSGQLESVQKQYDKAAADLEQYIAESNDLQAEKDRQWAELNEAHEKIEALQRKMLEKKEPNRVVRDLSENEHLLKFTMNQLKNDVNSIKTILDNVDNNEKYKTALTAFLKSAIKYLEG